MDQQELVQIQRIAHMLGANSASFGAGRLWKLCQQLEHATSLDGMDTVVAAAAEEFAEVRALLREELKALSAT